MKIGALGQKAGTTVPTIRYYEQIGLLPRPSRQAGGQRSYGEDDVRRLTFVRRCREFGFPIEQVQQLAGLVNDPGRSCLEARDLAKGHLATVRAKLSELRALEKAMRVFVERCDELCAGGPGPDCVVLQDLTGSEPSSSHQRRNIRQC